MSGAFVWISDEDMATPLDSAFREVVRNKRDAAPGDPVEQLAKAIYREYGPMGTSWGMADPLRRERFRSLSKNVLIRALGWEAS